MEVEFVLDSHQYPKIEENNHTSNKSHRPHEVNDTGAIRIIVYMYHDIKQCVETCTCTMYMYTAKIIRTSGIVQ